MCQKLTLIPALYHNGIHKEKNLEIFPRSDIHSTCIPTDVLGEGKRLAISLLKEASFHEFSSSATELRVTMYILKL